MSVNVKKYFLYSFEQAPHLDFKNSLLKFNPSRSGWLSAPSRANTGSNRSSWLPHISEYE
jgi:hypothetical protein